MQAPKVLRLLAFSDWRVQKIDDIFIFLKKLRTPPDLILYAGDDISRFKQGNINRFSDLAEYTNLKKVLAVIGNDENISVKKILHEKNIIDLHDKPFSVGEFGFMGLEGCTGDIGIVKYTEKAVKAHLEKQYEKIKNKKIKILVSHPPPYGILDKSVRFATEGGYHHVGSTALKAFIQRHKIDLVICGHSHLNGGKEATYKHTKILNVASNDEYGDPGILAIINVDINKNIENKWYDTSNLNKDSLTNLRGVGYAREFELNQIGIYGIKDFVKLKHVPSKLLPFYIEAKAYVENKIYQINTFEMPEKVIYYDIETELNISSGRIWLIGVLINGKYFYFYSDDWAHERNILLQFLEFLRKYPDYALVSYSCTNFDRNLIINALRRLNIDSVVFTNRIQIDLCQLISRSFVFPLKSYSLKSVLAYLKYPFQSEMDGYMVALEYLTHIKEKTPINKEVFKKNEDDVRGLEYIVRTLSSKTGVKIQKSFLFKTKSEN